jgi:hypothetical protein
MLNLNEKQARTRLSFALICGIFVCSVGLMSGCQDLQKRRVDIKQSSGADPELQDRFGLTADAQDPSERDKELGYGRWKTKPETEGTASPNSPARRQNIGGNPD